jgi:hypothetical protein
MEGFGRLVCSSKFPGALARISFEICRQFRHAPSEMLTCSAIVLLLDTGVSEKPAT